MHSCFLHKLQKFSLIISSITLLRFLLFYHFLQNLATNLNSFKAADKELALEVEEVKTGFDKTIKDNLDNLKLPKKDLEITTETNITNEDNAIWLDDEYDWKVEYE